MSTLWRRRSGVLLWIVLMLILSSLLAGCSTTDGDNGSGGGGGGGGTRNPPPGGAAPLVSTGPITAFGSIIVNGITFDIAQATIRLDDEEGRADNLRVGMVVTVTGARQETGPAKATTVVFRDNLEGPIESINSAESTIVVLGQTIRVNGLTVVEAVGRTEFVPVPTLAVGDFVEVSGVTDANGIIVATRIERRPGVTVVELKGMVSNVNVAAATLQIGALQVNFRDAIVEGVLANGLLVEVHGTQATLGGPLRATRVEVKEAVDVPDNAQVEIEGFVTAVLSSTRFRIGERVIQTMPQTLFENGDVTDIVSNVKLEAEGRLDAAGILVAEKISFRFAGGGNVKIEADVEAVDATASTVTLLGRVIQVPVGTQIKDNVGGVRDFSLAAIRVGDRLQVRGFLNAQGDVVTSRLERSDDVNEVILQGPVESIANPNVTILGVQIITIIGTEFEDVDDSTLTAAEFFAAVSRETLVKVRGIFQNTRIAADKVEIEIEDD